MLTKGDIEWMSDVQDEVYYNREQAIYVIYTIHTHDSFTGEIIGSIDDEREVGAVVTELSIRKGDGERYIESGLEYEAGDAKFDIKRESIQDISDVISRIRYEGIEYEILGDDRKGIGKRNRYEILGRVIT